MWISVLKALRLFRRDESGQSLIVIVSSMSVVLGLAAFAIDASSWMLHHHQDQVVADSAALAAADCLASPGLSAGSIKINGSLTAVPTCSSSGDTTDATTVAEDYAAANGVTITASQVSIDTTNDKVTVTPLSSAPGIFARLFGIGTSTQSAGAGAGWKTNPSACTTVGQNCDFMFANSNDCNAGSYVLIVATQGSSTINGDIQTNGNLDASATGNAGGINGTGNYGPGCTTTTGGNHNPWNTSAPSAESSVISWPTDYSKDFPACVPGGSGATACAANGYPPYCTNEAQNITFTGANGDAPISGNIYCASGSGGTKSDPSTWNGSIKISSSGNNTWDDTFVAGTISYTGSGGDHLSSCGYTSSGYSSATCSAPRPALTPNYPIFYDVGSDPNSTSCAAGTNVSTTCAFSISSTGNLKLFGDTFIENGTASLNFQGNQSAGNTFFEANVIKATLAGNFNGDGPSPTGGGGSTGGGSVTLVQ